MPARPGSSWSAVAPKATRPSWTAASAPPQCCPAPPLTQATCSPQQDLLRDPDRGPGPRLQPDGSLFYPDTRVFFDGIVRDYIPDGEFSPIWNPEFFGNTIMVNGNTWPFQTVEKRRYRLRFLNGCQSRFLILDFSEIPGVEAWQIGNEGGFLDTAPGNLPAANPNHLLRGLAERADLIVDFTNVPVGDYVLANIGPDEPFGGGEPPDDFDTA